MSGVAHRLDQASPRILKREAVKSRFIEPPITHRRGLPSNQNPESQSILGAAQESAFVTVHCDRSQQSLGEWPKPPSTWAQLSLDREGYFRVDFILTLRCFQERSAV